MSTARERLATFSNPGSSWPGLLSPEYGVTHVLDDVREVLNERSTIVVVSETAWGSGGVDYPVAVYATEELAQAAIDRCIAALAGQSPRSYRNFGLDEMEVRTDLTLEL